MIGLNDLGCVHRVDRLPCVVTFRVAVPFDKVLKGSGASMTSVAPYLLHFVFLLSIDKVRWWPGEVRSVGGCFVIGR